MGGGEERGQGWWEDDGDIGSEGGKQVVNTMCPHVCGDMGRMVAPQP